MTKKTIITVIGGDERIVYLLNLLNKHNYKVFHFGFEKYILNENYDFETSIKESQFIICGTPFSKDNKTIFTPYSNEIFYIEDLVNLIDTQKIFASYISTYLSEYLSNNNINYTDYSKDNSIKNIQNMATFEGVLNIMISNTKKTLFGSKVLIIGYGNTGKIITQQLALLGCQTSVVTLNESDIQESKKYTFNNQSYGISSLNKQLSKKDFIINTVPEIQINKNNMNFLDKETLLIDIASSPFGIEKNDLENDFKLYYPAGLPGIIAPYSIGNAIFDFLKKELE